MKKNHFVGRKAGTPSQDALSRIYNTDHIDSQAGINTKPLPSVHKAKLYTPSTKLCGDGIVDPHPDDVAARNNKTSTTFNVSAPTDNSNLKAYDKDGVLSANLSAVDIPVLEDVVLEIDGVPQDNPAANRLRTELEETGFKGSNSSESKFESGYAGLFDDQGAFTYDG